MSEEKKNADWITFCDPVINTKTKLTKPIM